jgi:hypothetical protein
MVAGRFLPGGRTATMAAAGVAALPAVRVVRASALGSALWASWTVGLGYLTGRTIDLPFWANSLIGATLGIGVGVLMALVLAIRRRAAPSGPAADLSTSAASESPLATDPPRTSPLVTDPPRTSPLVTDPPLREPLVNEPRAGTTEPPAGD